MGTESEDDAGTWALTDASGEDYLTVVRLCGRFVGLDK